MAYKQVQWTKKEDYDEGSKRKRPGRGGNNNHNNREHAGNVIFQRAFYDQTQMQHIKTLHSTRNKKSAPYMLFADNDIDKYRKNNTKRIHFGGESAVMGHYDRLFGYGITTTFYKLSVPDLNTFKTLMDKEFEPLQQHLLNGYDVIIPKIKKNIFYQNNKQVIYHNIGAGTAALPFKYLLYIQRKIDELREYAKTTKIIIVQCYNYTPNVRTNNNNNNNGTNIKIDDDAKSQEIPKTANVIKSNTRNDELQKWLNKIGLMEYHKLFIDEGFGERIGFEELLTLNNEELKGIGIEKLAHRKIIIKSIEEGINNSNTLRKDNIDNITPGNDDDIDLYTKQVLEYNERLEKEREEYRIKAEDEEKQKLELQNNLYSVSWEWRENNDEWRLYTDDTNKKIEALKMNEILRFKADNNQIYEIERSSKYGGMQQNTKTNVVREIRRREQVKRGYIEYPYWWNIEGSQIEGSLSDQYGIPQLIEMNLCDEKTKEIATAFYNTSRDHVYYKQKHKDIKIKIIQIESVQNQRLYDKYWNERNILKKSIGENKLNERYLWHGTRTEDTMETITKQGFRKEFNKNAKYGEGTYFAVNSGYSFKYSSNNTDTYKMFQCKVICGESIEGDSKYKLKSWPKKSNGLIYDSLVHNKDLNKSIYIIHDDVRAYPMFVITFKAFKN